MFPLIGKEGQEYLEKIARALLLLQNSPVGPPRGPRTRADREAAKPDISAMSGKIKTDVPSKHGSNFFKRGKG
jgi:hypothetical protein